MRSMRTKHKSRLCPNGGGLFTPCSFEREREGCKEIGIVETKQSLGWGGGERIMAKCERLWREKIGSCYTNDTSWTS